MAYSFGGGVRPELGRTDFTPFLQGSVRGAEMQARGAENFAAGVSQFLAKAGEGVKAYQENKAINTMFNSTVDDAIKINEEGGGELARMLKIADPSDRGAWAAGIKSLGEGDKKKGSMAVRAFMMQMAQQEKQRAEIAAALAPRPSAAQDAIMGGASFEDIPTGAGAFMQRQPNAQEIFTSLAPTVGVGAAADAAGFFQKEEEIKRKANEEDWKAKTERVYFEDGTYADMVYTSPNSANFRQRPDDSRPAAVAEADYRTKALASLPQLLARGENSQAMAIAVGLRIPGAFGEPVTIDQLRQQFPVPAFANEADAMASGLSPGTFITIGGRRTQIPDESPDSPVPEVLSVPEAPVVPAPQEVSVPSPTPVPQPEQVAPPTAQRAPLTEEDRVARNAKNRERVREFLSGLPAAGIGALDAFGRADQAFSGAISDANSAVANFLFNTFTGTNDSEESVATLKRLAQEKTGVMKESLLQQARSMELRLARKEKR